MYDHAEEGLRSAESALEAAKAQLGTAKDAFAYTELRAGAAGVITARNFEVGQVVQVAQPAFSLAQDGEREAVFDVDEFFLGELDGPMALRLVSDPWERGCGHQDFEVCRTDHRAMDRDDGLGGKARRLDHRPEDHDCAAQGSDDRPL